MTGPARSLSLRVNALVQIAAKTVGMVLGLVLSPFIVAHLGLTVFGFWALISALTQYAALLDIGVGSSLIRYVSELDKRHDFDRLETTAATGLWLSVVFCAIVTALAAVVVLLLPASATHSWPSGWEIATVSAVLGLGLTSVSSVYQSFAGGLSRWDLFNVPPLAGQVLSAVATVVVLELGGGLGSLALSMLAGNVFAVLVALVVCRPMLGVSLHPRFVRRADLRELGLYGLNLQTASFVKVINAQSDKFVLLAFADLRFIGLYELGSRVAFSLRSLPVVAFGPMVAAAAAEAADGVVERIRAFYHRMLEATLRIGVAPLAALYGACYPLVLAWLGPSYETSAAICAVLGIGYTINIATGAGTSVANGAGRPQFDRDYSLLGLAINLILTFALGALIGPWGVIIATAVGLALSTVWLMVRVDRWLDARTLGLRALWRFGLGDVLVGAAFGGAAVVAQRAVSSDSRWLSLAIGCATVAAYAITWMTLRHQWGALIGRLRRSELTVQETAS